MCGCVCVYMISNFSYYGFLSFWCLKNLYLIDPIIKNYKCLWIICLKYYKHVCKKNHSKVHKCPTQPCMSTLPPNHSIPLCPVRQRCRSWN